MPEPSPTSSPDATADAVGEEALRLFRRYQLEVVEAFNLCPWAEKARSDGSIAERVLAQQSQDFTPTLRAIEELADRPEFELCIFIFPRIDLGKQDFDRFVSQIVREDAKRHGPGRIPFAMAAFHPEAVADLSTPDRLIPFLRRTPDPTIQLVRSSVLERVKSGKGDGTRFVDPSQLVLTDLSSMTATKSVRQRISEANLETAQRVGVQELQRITNDIIHDRERSYSKIGVG